MSQAISVNLLPRQLVVAQTLRRRRRRWLAVCVLAALVLAIPVGMESYRMARAEELRLEGARLHQERETVETELTQIITASHEAFLQIERAKALREKRSWSAVLALLADTMPKGCWLTELATDPPAPTGAQARTPADAPATMTGGPATIVIEAPRTLRIYGYASDAAEPLTFVRSLKNSNAFAQVVLRSTQRELAESEYYFRFELQCEW